MPSEVLFVVVFTFFPIVVNTVAGLKSADPEMLQLARSMTASPLQSLWKIKIPGALPTIFAGIKISITMAPVGAVIGEFVASNVGLGHVLIQAVGDSMNPTFNSGALLLVNTKVNQIKNDSIYVINRDDELIVKRIQDLWNGQIKIKSDNPKYEPLIIQKTDAIKIVGEVVWIGQKN